MKFEHGFGPAMAAPYTLDNGYVRTQLRAGRFPMYRWTSPGRERYFEAKHDHGGCWTVREYLWINDDDKAAHEVGHTSFWSFLKAQEFVEMAADDSAQCIPEQHTNFRLRHDLPVDERPIPPAKKPKRRR